MEKIALFWRKKKLSLKRKMTADRVIFVIIAIATLYFVGYAITAMTRNWQLEQTLAEKSRQKALLELEVETMALENRYYASDEYQELSARMHQNKMAEGETMIYLPKNSESAKNKHQEETASAGEEARPSNLSQWLTFLFGV